jgi:hypothetical protein
VSHYGDLQFIQEFWISVAIRAIRSYIGYDIMSEFTIVDNYVDNVCKNRHMKKLVFTNVCTNGPIIIHYAINSPYIHAYYFILKYDTLLI